MASARSVKAWSTLATTASVIIKDPLGVVSETLMSCSSASSLTTLPSERLSAPGSSISYMVSANYVAPVRAHDTERGGLR
jgi:hypothetical protein